MRLGNIRQIILYVKNMAKQVEFYSGVMGLDIAFPHVDDYSSEDWVAFDTGECTLALHSGGQGRIGQDAPKFTFEVTDVAEMMEYLDDKGVKMSKKVEAYPGSYVSSGKDPEGNVFFVQDHPNMSDQDHID